MKKIIGTSLFVFALLFSITGCRVAQIKNVPMQSTLVEKPKEDVYKAIYRAGTSLGWRIKKVDENTLLGTLNLRSHTAVVTIKYSAKDYSITYKSSIDLDYNEEQNNIHSNYNGWISNLEKSIRIQLDTM